jgi:Asp-tRNA(Asn)/Glu-tRNA(Gln) amidotransferase C subunit
MSGLNGKEIDVLLHLELQKSSQYCESIEKELQDIVGIVDTYEIYKAKGSDKRSFPDFLQYNQTGRQLREDKAPERRSSTKRYPHVTVATSNYLNTSAVLKKLKNLEL